ncbi:toprim domain-containing protein [uncultured Rheinheimera sp.]|uniref:toprim domain-containing protein n=1 Tax=uncultured Rheinheimera sp. TaxID=400532 RepID=UPI002597796F|nr:toprim domain-containing protein [uncultured Rheinheimera sp.]
MQKEMYRELLQVVLPRLEQDFDFKAEAKGGFLQQGKCPACGKKELYTNASSPWLLRCGRLNKCGETYHIKELYPEFFNSWSDRFPVAPTATGGTVANPNATADAYLQHGRGFDITPLQGWYTQGSFYCGKRDMGTATVRFQIAPDVYWERFIDRPERFGKQKANFVGSYQGLCWLPPQFDPLNLVSVKEIWFTEGVFDAIALIQNGVTAAALMSCNNFPGTFLEQLHTKLPAGSRPTLVFALDDGKAGEMFTKKFVKQARELGWKATAAQPPKGRVKLDWNELHQREQLTAKDLDEYRYNGQLLVALSATQKAGLMYSKHGWKEFPFGHNSRLFWFKLDLDRFDRAKADVVDQADRDKEELTEEEIRERALQESGSVAEIANCFPQALYFQENKLTDESWYYFRVDFPHDGASVKNTFSGSQLSSGSEFKKRLLGMAPGAVFTGQSNQLDRLMSKQLFNIKRVQTTDFIGYSREYGCYVFNDSAVKDGRLFELNDEDFFDIGKLSIKSLNQSVDLHLNRKFSQLNTEWPRKLWQAFGAKGFVALAYWFGSFFAEQIRKEQKSYPFLEIIGEPGTGKTTLIEFMWKLAGRNEYEGFDPSKSTLAARARNFAQVSNMPVVMIEGDRGDGKDPKQKGFDWDETKPLYNGRSVRSRGLRNNGNETYEPPFRAALVIAQNAEVNASEAVLQRICQIHTDRSGQTAKTKEAAEWLERISVEDVSGFMLKAIMNESKVMQVVTERTRFYEDWLAKNSDVKNIRIIKNHAQLCSLVEALAIAADINQEQIEQTHQLLLEMTAKRQLLINADHPLVQEFWDAFEFIDGDDHPVLNHSRDPKLIAVNLNHFAEIASERRQQFPPLTELKRVLKSCRSRKFIGVRTVNSLINQHWNDKNQFNKRPTSVKCWVFEKEK